IVERMIENLIQMLNEVWSQIYPLNMKYDSFETDPQFVQIARSSETIAIIFFEIKVRGAVFPMNVGFPYFVLEPILQKLSTQTFFVNVRKVTEDERKMVEQRIRATKLPVKTIFSETEISVRDFLGLQKGDLIQLDKSLDDEVQVRIGEKLKYFAVPGRSGRKTAVKITRQVDVQEKLAFEK
ncbi:FliM/FliN family flagellar motor switch protein, partial [bacterium]|nr:FliM/FliN family flagellar motor switch protein [bacterium]